jgi:hypothetical protein
VTIKNLPASVHGRLMNRARATNRPFQELLQYYAMERFLWRGRPRHVLNARESLGSRSR